MVVKYKLRFVSDPNKGNRWTVKSAKAWFKKMRDAIRNAWKDKCVFSASCCKKCENVSVAFDVQNVSKAEDADYRALVFNFPGGAAHAVRPTPGINAIFYQNSVDLRAPLFGREIQQVAVAHEFGHALGLLHPYHYSFEATHTITISGDTFPPLMQLKPAVLTEYGEGTGELTTIMGTGMTV